MNVNSTIAAGEQVAEILKFSTGQVTSTDGTIIGYRQIGQGPVLNFKISATCSPAAIVLFTFIVPPPVTVKVY